MRLDADRLTFLALAALYQIASDARRSPIRDPATMRFILAVLYAESGGDRAAFDRFWRAARKMPIGPDTTTTRHDRWLAVNAEWEHIARSVGCEPTKDLVSDILDAIGARQARRPHDC